ncbi:hypothetical protein WOLCODRAFT_16001 [Wolfiporia cocos MD-104 SS10]|uniref:Uncharacterized protein n=1 Tax=Wolfiporia cocos (strain MD-104) TaxID=742152 RepID=A0A2H3JFR5_WOLCO|nr:hypothetical protein WOLCODRAFT_16001 [Wolfiporia cocos MD-104 SS10]
MSDYIDYPSFCSIIDSGFYLIPGSISDYSELAHALVPKSSFHRTYTVLGTYQRRYLRTITRNGKASFWFADALSDNFEVLDNAEDPCFTSFNESQKPSIRIECGGHQFPGCPPYTKQIPIRDFRNQSRPLSLSKQIKAIAKAINDIIEVDLPRLLLVNFLEQLIDQSYNNAPCQADRRWSLGSNGINIRHLVLVGLFQVSGKGSQPTLFVVSRIWLLASDNSMLCPFVI